MKNNKINSEKVKKQIMSNTREKLFKDGFKRISMDEIANDLHISKKTFYIYFSSKENLLRTISTAYLRNAYTIIISIAQSRTNVVEKFIGFSDMVKEYYKVFNEDSLNRLRKYYPQLASDIEEFRNTRVIPIIKVLLKIGKRKKMILDIPDEIILQVFASALGHIAESKLESFSEQSYHHKFRYAFNILLNGILTKKGRQILNYKLEVNK